MFKIAIVEDEVSCVEVLKKHIMQYGEEYKITFQIQKIMVPLLLKIQLKK